MEEWIVVVDDSTINLQAAKHIFNEEQISARYLRSCANSRNSRPMKKFP